MAPHDTGQSRRRETRTEGKKSRMAPPFLPCFSGPIHRPGRADPSAGHLINTQVPTTQPALPTSAWTILMLLAQEPHTEQQNLTDPRDEPDRNQQERGHIPSEDKKHSCIRAFQMVMRKTGWNAQPGALAEDCCRTACATFPPAHQVCAGHGCHEPKCASPKFKRRTPEPQ